jgi:F-type H+-transporting ATPase subunit epsilon
VPIKLEIVTPERVVLTEDVDMVIAPASEGYVGILPHHAPLLTTLGPGELRIKKGGTETALAIFGGFMDVRPDRVVILTEAAEQADQIDAARAEAARARAREVLQAGPVGLDEARARASLERAMVRLRVTERRRRRGG